MKLFNISDQDYINLIILERNGTNLKTNIKMTNKKPNNWQELEELVEYIYNESGFKATRGKKIKTVRGEVNVDVFVETKDELGTNIICECKYWSRPVTQEVVHSFRTVVNDFGSSTGIIISKSGFQTGAFKAIKNTNIKLYTWDQFLDVVFPRWYSYNKKELIKLAYPLGVYTDPFDLPFSDLNESQIDEYKLTVVEHIKTKVVASFIFEDPVVYYNEIFNEQIETYEEYFCIMKGRVNDAIEYYQEFFFETEIEEWKLIYRESNISK